MKKNKSVYIIENVTVTDAGAKGKSIAHAPDGRVIFVENAVPEDIVDIQVTKRKKAFYEGTVVKFHQQSSLRECLLWWLSMAKYELLKSTFL